MDAECGRVGAIQECGTELVKWGRLFKTKTTRLTRNGAIDPLGRGPLKTVALSSLHDKLTEPVETCVRPRSML